MGNYIKPDTSRYSMMWYKFLIYFGLFASAIVNLGQGVMIIKGDVYSKGDITADMIYNTFGHMLKTIDCVYGVCAIIMAVVAVVFWSMLIHYRKKALKYVNVFYGGMLVTNVMYIICIILTINDWVPLASSAFTAIITHTFMLWANNKYFSKRSSLFIN